MRISFIRPELAKEVVLYNYSFRSFRWRSSSAKSMEVRSVSSRLNKRPHPKLSISKPSTQLLASSTVIVLITKRNSPKVMMVRGKVNKISKGRKKAFSKPNTIANQMAVPYPLTCTPVSTCASINATAADTSIRIINFICYEFIAAYQITTSS